MLGLHKDPRHFGSAISPIEAEVRRRVWWHLIHIDTHVAVATGLPPLVDLNSWDVQGVSELKEELIGTPTGEEYELAVKDQRRLHDDADDGASRESRSMVSVAGIRTVGKLRYACEYQMIFIEHSC